MLKLVVLGSITEDFIINPIHEQKQYIGGVPIYAASVAKALGEQIGIVSKVGTDFHLKNLKLIHNFGADLNGFQISGKSSMRFENKYNSKGQRTQKILSVSEKITFNDIPESYYNVPCIHLGPVFNEIDLDLISKVREIFPFVSLDGQGFIRGTKESSKKIIHKPWNGYAHYFDYLDLLKVDDTELKNMTNTKQLDEAIDQILETNLHILVITRAHKGAIIFKDKQQFEIPAIPTKVVDETGAGDTFITAFLLEYLKTKDCYYSGLIAASTASFKIANSGPKPKYNRNDIIAKLKSNLPDFQEK